MIEFRDPYIDPETGILRNLVGARTRDELNAAEANLTVARVMDLRLNPVRLTGDAAQLREIHRRIFQDVFDWAGQFRIVDISKAGTAFMPVSRIELGARNALMQLSDERMLKGLSTEEFVQRLAFHYDQINYLHPFREGNGRTQRVFWEQIARAAGHPISFEKVDDSTNNHASRAAANGDLSPLIQMLRIVVGESREAGASVGRRPPKSGQGRRPANSPGGTGGQFTSRYQDEPDIDLGPETPA